MYWLKKHMVVWMERNVNKANKPKCSSIFYPMLLWVSSFSQLSDYVVIGNLKKNFTEFLFQNISDRLSPLPKKASIDSYRSVSPIALANLKFKREEPSIKKQRPVKATKKRFARLQRPSEGYMPCVHESLFQ